MEIVESQLPVYQCHKKVKALEIRSIINNEDGTARIVPVETDFSPFEISSAYMEKHKPQPGGFWVRYKNGYESWTPGDVFRDGYSRIDRVKDWSLVGEIEELTIVVETGTGDVITGKVGDLQNRGWKFTELCQFIKDQHPENVIEK